MRQAALHAIARRLDGVLADHVGAERRQVAVPEDDLGRGHWLDTVISFSLCLQRLDVGDDVGQADPRAPIVRIERAEDRAPHRHVLEPCAREGSGSSPVTKASTRRAGNVPPLRRAIAVTSGGATFNAGAAGPPPFPSRPWHDAQ